MSDIYTNAHAVRHEDLCKPGMWFANLTITLGYFGGGHIHADCVVDDYGTLRMVNVYGMTDGPNWRIETREQQ